MYLNVNIANITLDRDNEILAESIYPKSFEFGKDTEFEILIKKGTNDTNTTKPMAYDALLGCVIFRIDGNKCFSEPIKGIMGHYKTREGAEKHLQERGFYLETRKWQHIGGHEEGTKDNKWYDKKLSDDGYSYDNTSYAFITEVELRD